MTEKQELRKQDVFIFSFAVYFQNMSLKSNEEEYMATLRAEIVFIGK